MRGALVTSDMSEQLKLELKPETTEKIEKIDSAILYWSVQLSQAMIKLREVESQIGNLYDFKKTAVLEDLKAQNVDIDGCDVSTTDSKNVVITKPVKPQTPPGD